MYYIIVSIALTVCLFSRRRRVGFFRASRGRSGAARSFSIRYGFGPLLFKRKIYGFVCAFF
jgi:hypothetical protein